MSITIDNIRRSFGPTVALDNINFEIPDKSLIALVGPSGSGKTTLLRIIAGLDYPDAVNGGRILFDGQDVTFQPAAKRKIGFVFQHYALFPHMTVFDNIAFGMKVRPKAERPSKEEIREKVIHLLDRIQLSGYENRLPAQMSGGQRQRIALARALAVNPSVLLLDEPFGALDARVRKDLRQWLRRFHDEIQVTTIFVTHDQEEALELADEIVVMNQGKVEQKGAPQAVFDAPATPFVFSFLGEVNVIQGRDGVRHVRPHDIELHFASDTEAEISGRIRHLFAAGPVARLSVQLDGSNEYLDIQATREDIDEMALAVGDPVGLSFRNHKSEVAAG